MRARAPGALHVGGRQSSDREHRERIVREKRSEAIPPQQRRAGMRCCLLHRPEHNEVDTQSRGMLEVFPRMTRGADELERRPLRETHEARRSEMNAVGAGFRRHVRIRVQ